jgi:hypothetical protein
MRNACRTRNLIDNTLTDSAFATFAYETRIRIAVASEYPSGLRCPTAPPTQKWRFAVSEQKDS